MEQIASSLPTQNVKIAGFECDTDIENVRIHTMMQTTAFLPNAPLQTIPHNHPVFEAHIFVSGKTDMVTSGGIYRLQKNDLIILPPQMYHYAREAEGPISSIAFAFRYSKISNNHPTTDLYSMLDERLSDRTEPLCFEQIFPLAHRLFELTEEMSRHLAGKRNRLKTQTALVIYALMELLCPEARGEYTDNLSQITRQQYAIDTFFARNYQNNITIKDLADTIYLSERHANRILLELYHQTFKQKLIETRIQTAMQLLLSTELSISEIAQQSGYRSSVGFHSAFAQICGMTPAKYRAKMKKNIP